jgi:dihydrofolate reductase
LRAKFDIIVATDLNRGIGKNNQLPWRISTDLKYFRDLTSSTPVPDVTNAVIMGRKTWESIPAGYRPLKNRVNVVLTRNPDYSLPQGVFKADSLDAALTILSRGPVDRVFVIGGAQVYAEAMQHEKCGLLYLTLVRHQFDCDAFLPDYRGFFQLASCSEVMMENNLEFCFKVYQFNFPEYLAALE